jgi:small subunit ribosomal protein S6e
MEAKVVVGTKTGKSYNIEVKDDLAAVFVGKHIGDIVNATPLGLKGYEVKITGGSDKQGFPMRKDAHIIGRTKALMSTRTQGYRPEVPSDGVRLRKTVVGNIIDERISQINTLVVKEGKDSIEKLLGLEKPEEGAPDAEAKPADVPKEEKSGEGDKAEVPKIEKPEAAPKEEKPEASPKEEKPAPAPKEEKQSEGEKAEAPSE